MCSVHKILNTTAPSTIEVSTVPPIRKFGILEDNTTGSNDTRKALVIIWIISTTPEYTKKFKTRFIVNLSPFTEKMIKKNNNTIISIKPEVPTSNTPPTVETVGLPEKNEETSAPTGNSARGISIFVFGNNILPIDKVLTKNKATSATKNVTSMLIFAEYKGKVILGIKNSGIRKTNPTKTYLDILIRLNLLVC